MTQLAHKPWCTDHTDDPDGGLCATRLTYVDDAGGTVTVTASVGRPDERRVLVDADVSDMSHREARELGMLLLRAAGLTDGWRAEEWAGRPFWV